MSRVPDWMGILAAMAYLSLFLAVTYAVYMFVSGGPLIASLVGAFPAAFVACALFFLCSAVVEAWQSAAKRAREAAEHPTQTRYSLHH